MTRFYVTAPNPRPVIHLPIAFLWRAGQNVDTDGDCDHPLSRDWTDLYIKNREPPDEPPVDVSPLQSSPLILTVESQSASLATRLAYFLAVSVQGEVSRKPDGGFASPDTLLSELGNFDVDAAMRRVAESPYLQATRKDGSPLG